MPPFFDLFRDSPACAAAAAAFAVIIAAAFGAWAGARAALGVEDARRARDIEAAANVAIAAMVALLGKLINFKKDLVAPAQADARQIEGALAEAGGDGHKTGVHLDLWAEIPFGLHMPFDRLYGVAAGDLDLIQLVKMLEYNLAELAHLVSGRNENIRRMNGYQSSNGTLPVDGLKLYLKQAQEIARNVEEDLFFIDRAIGATRNAAKALLPKSRHRHIADIGLKADAAALMPPRDLIKGWVK